MFDNDTAYNSDPTSFRRVEVVMPIVKSLEAEDRGLWQEGIASSERRDVQGDIIALSRATNDIPHYLRRTKAAVDYNHRSDDIVGRCEDAAYWNEAQIQKSLAASSHGVVPPVLYVKNKINPLSKNRGLWTKGQEIIYRAHEAGDPLFMSAYGKGMDLGRGRNSAGEEGNLVVPTIFNRIAVTREPVNADAYSHVTIAKSLGDFFGELQEGDHTYRNGSARQPHELPALVYVAPNCYDSEHAKQVMKSLEATGAIPVAGTEGGDSLKNLGASSGGGMKKCRQCDCELHPMAKFCHRCATPFEESEVRKSLSINELVAQLARPRAVLCRNGAQDI